jgi:hypothetical protein
LDNPTQNIQQRRLFDGLGKKTIAARSRGFVLVPLRHMSGYGVDRDWPEQGISFSPAGRFSAIDDGKEVNH